MPYFKDAVDKSGDTMTGSLVLASPATLTVSALTANSIPYIGASGLVSQNTGNFVWDNSNRRLGVGTSTPATAAHFNMRDSATTTVTTIGTFAHNSTGTPAAGFGSGFDILCQSDTTQNRNVGRFTAAWVVATDASRTSRTTIWAADSVGFRDGFHVESDGTGANCGFFSFADYGSGRNVIAIPNRAVAPSGTPTGGGILYSASGAGTWKGSSGTVTGFGPAGPHCGNCGADFWRTNYVNDSWGAHLRECGWCGKVYRKGPASFFDKLTVEQRSEIIVE